MNTIPLRPLGKTGLKVSEIGLGCNRVGEKMLGDDEWIRLLHQAADWGVTLFDTAEQYAGGRSQELIGKAFGNRQDIIVSTKVSALKNGEGPKFTYQSIVEGAEKCLRILKRDCMEIFQTHGSGSLQEVSDESFAGAMDHLRQSGKILIRASATFDAEGACYAIENGLIDSLQITYNLIDRNHASPILPVAEKHGMGLLARMPYHRGSLTGKFQPGDTVPEGHRALLQGDKLKDDIAAAERFRSLGASRGGGMAELAMQYVLNEPCISSTIPGARSIEQLRINIDNALAGPLTNEEIAEIVRIQGA